MMERLHVPASRPDQPSTDKTNSGKTCSCLHRRDVNCRRYPETAVQAFETWILKRVLIRPELIPKGSICPKHPKIVYFNNPYWPSFPDGDPSVIVRFCQPEGLPYPHRLPAKISIYADDRRVPLKLDKRNTVDLTNACDVSTEVLFKLEIVTKRSKTLKEDCFVSVLLMEEGERTPPFKLGRFPLNKAEDIIKKSFNSSNSANDVTAVKLEMSLLCPLSKKRMNQPCRPDCCSHLQCFDAQTFLDSSEFYLYEWRCPICNRILVQTDLCIDELTEGILAKTPEGCSSVKFSEDLTWEVVNDALDAPVIDLTSPYGFKGTSILDLTKISPDPTRSVIDLTSPYPQHQTVNGLTVNLTTNSPDPRPVTDKRVLDLTTISPDPRLVIDLISPALQHNTVNRLMDKSVTDLTTNSPDPKPVTDLISPAPKDNTVNEKTAQSPENIAVTST